MEFVGNVGLADVQAAWAGAQKIEANPLRFAARLTGLGSDELDAGVPTWAWVTVAFGAGALAAVLWGGKIRDRVQEVF